MKKLQKVLIPIDFTPVSENAMAYAIGVLEHRPSEVLFVYVKPVDSIQTDDELEHNFKDYYQELLQKATFPYEFRSTEGVLLDALIKVKALSDADMIIMGTKGKRPSNVSVAASLVRMVYCPVLVVPEGYASHQIKKIVFANDYKPIRSSEAIRPLWELALNNGAKVILLHVNLQREPVLLEDDMAESSLDYYLDSLEHEYVYLSNENVEQAINGFMAENEIDLLSILSRDHGSNQLKSESRLIAQLTAYSGVPVLVLC